MAIKVNTGKMDCQGKDQLVKKIYRVIDDGN